MRFTQGGSGNVVSFEFTILASDVDLFLVLYFVCNIIKYRLLWLY